MNRKILPSLLLAAFLSPLGSHAQTGMDDERLAGLELEYVGKDYSDRKATIYLDLTYFHLFASHQYGWNGGDGVYSTTLPDGNSFWSFGDSFFGLISEYRDRTRASNLPRNAAMIQTGEESWRDFVVLNEYCSTDPNDREHYYKGKTWLRHPRAKALSQQQIDAGETDSDHFYWPGDATVIKRDGKPVLQVLWGSIFGNMERDETALTEYSLEGEPGDEGYMKLTALYPNVVDYVTSYGNVNPQIIRFGENILDLVREVRGENVATVLVPLGAADEETGEKLTVKSVNDGLDYIEDAEAIQTYGRIVKTVEYDDVTVASNLLTKGYAELAKMSKPVSINTHPAGRNTAQGKINCIP